MERRKLEILCLNNFFLMQQFLQIDKQVCTIQFKEKNPTFYSTINKCTKRDCTSEIHQIASNKQHLRRLEATVHDHQKGMIWVF